MLGKGYDFVVLAAVLVAASWSGVGADDPPGDFNGDGYADLVVGSPSADGQSGSVTVFYGSEDGLRFNPPGSLSPRFGGRAPSDRLGESMAIGQFNWDETADLVVGAPHAQAGGAQEVGYIEFLFGGVPGGLGSWFSGELCQGTAVNGGVIGGTPEPGDRFGEVLAVGNFDGRSRDDLVVGSPHDHHLGMECGSVTLLHSLPDVDGLVGDGVFLQGSASIADEPEDGDEFGAALAVGDFDGDGLDDLVIGVPGETLVENRDGAINVLYGDLSNYLESRPDRSLLHDPTPAAEARFGGLLKVGDFNDDPYEDLAVGVPDDTVSGRPRAGSVTVFWGSGTGLTNDDCEEWTQSTPGVGGVSEERDRFGYALAVGDFDGNGSDDLAIAVPYEDYPNEALDVDSGVINILYGDVDQRGRLTPDSEGRFWCQRSPGVGGATEAGDRFGLTLAVGDFDNDDYDDLVVGVPFETYPNAPVASRQENAGVLNLLLGSPHGLEADANGRFWSQNNLNVADQCEAGDLFGCSLAVGDFNGNGYADLAVGVPREDYPEGVNAGGVNVLYGCDDVLVAHRGEPLLWDGYTECIDDLFGELLLSGGSSAHVDGCPSE